MSLPQLALAMLAGLALDWLLGEPRRWHPLVGFGHLAARLERRCNRNSAPDANAHVENRVNAMSGAAAWSLAVLPSVIVACIAAIALARISWVAACTLHAALLYFALGLRSLRDHVMPIANALARNDIQLARTLTSCIVTRDNTMADESELAKAAIESTLENGNDAVFGALFWFAIAGGPGALLFRLANTLDAMWGYRTPRFLSFGRAAARIDDLLNLLPARLTALSYALLGNTRLAWQCWRSQAPAWSSPNAGPVMAAGAGALELALGGPACYDGVIEKRPTLGSGRPARAADIVRAWRLVAATALLWAAAIGGTAFLIEARF